MAAPVELALRHVITGGNLKTPWCPDVVEVGGAQFVKLSQADRNLATFCGADSSARAPLRDNTFLVMLSAARNQAVSNLITNKNREARVKRPRREVMDDLLPTVTITINAFEFEGQIVGPHNLTMLTTPSPMAVPSVELTASNIAFVRTAIQAHFDGGGEGTPVREPRVRRTSFCGQANVHYNARRGYVYVRLRGVDGRMSMRSITPRRSDIPHVNTQFINDAALELQRVYDEENVPAPAVLEAGSAMGEESSEASMADGAADNQHST
jgi:hypothetical protein